jgi:hypothetical protein
MLKSLAERATFAAFWLSRRQRKDHCPHPSQIEPRRIKARFRLKA